MLKRTTIFGMERSLENHYTIFFSYCYFSVNNPLSVCSSHGPNIKGLIKTSTFILRKIVQKKLFFIFVLLVYLNKIKLS